jgi:hypothetical protein
LVLLKNINITSTANTRTMHIKINKLLDGGGGGGGNGSGGGGGS